MEGIKDFLLLIWAQLPINGSWFLTIWIIGGGLFVLSGILQWFWFEVLFRDKSKFEKVVERKYENPDDIHPIDPLGEIRYTKDNKPVFKEHEEWAELDRSVPKWISDFINTHGMAAWKEHCEQNGIEYTTRGAEDDDGQKW